MKLPQSFEIMVYGVYLDLFAFTLVNTLFGDRTVSAITFSRMYIPFYKYVDIEMWFVTMKSRYFFFFFFVNF